MALNPVALKKKMSTTIEGALKREFAKEMASNSASADTYRRLAAAISDIAADIVAEILTNALVAPGQTVAGAWVGSGPAIAGATTTPGRIT
jgi:hypothetical protein